MKIVGVETETIKTQKKCVLKSLHTGDLIMKKSFTFATAQMISIQNFMPVIMDLDLTHYVNQSKMKAL